MSSSSPLSLSDESALEDVFLDVDKLLASPPDSNKETQSEHEDLSNHSFVSYFTGQSTQSVKLGSNSDQYATRSLCMTKTAIQARENRQKKKVKINTLEATISQLKTENFQLKSSASRMEQELTKLRDEVKYLRSVLANDSVLASLLGNIASAPGVRLSSSVHQLRPKRLKDHESPMRNTGRKGTVTHDHSYLKTPAGICLHVNDQRVSLEFCAECSKMAGEAFREEAKD